jgi:hypothetical protein
VRKVMDLTSKADPIDVLGKRDVALGGASLTKT